MAGTYLDFLREQLGGNLGQFQNYFDQMMQKDPNFKNLLNKQHGDNPFSEMQQYMKRMFPDNPDIGKNFFNKHHNTPKVRRGERSIDPAGPMGPEMRFDRAGFAGGFHGAGDGKGGVFDSIRDNPKSLWKILRG